MEFIRISITYEMGGYLRKDLTFIWHKLHRITQRIFSGNMIIFWMMLASISPMLLSVYFSYNFYKKSLNETIRHNINISLIRKIAMIDTYISERKLDIVQLVKLPSLLQLIKESESHINSEINQTPLGKSLDGYLKDVASKIGINNFYLVGLDETLLFSMNTTEYPIGQKILAPGTKQTRLYQAFIGAKILQIPYLLSYFKKDSNHIYLSNIVVDEGRVKAVLIASLDINAIQQVIDRVLGFAKSETTFLATFINKKPSIVMQSNLSMNFITENPKVLNYLARSISGDAEYPIWIQEGKKSFLIVSRYVSALNMGMLIGYDETEIYSQIYRLKLSMLLLIVISLLIIFTLVYWISNALRKINKKNENLLTSILPGFVIDELNEKKQFAARNIDHVSIIFMDIANFTPFAASASPEHVINSLDNLFSIFDALCDEYQLEKIKTIGDAHMSTAGLIYYQENHANLAVDMALDALLAIKHYNLDHNTDFSLRIGIDSGQITSGIIGKRKPNYDIWGNAVNCASRMESTAPLNQIQITEATYAALINPQAYTITKRSQVMIKGIGIIDTYLVSSHTSSSTTG
jgi:class 3 adenylate cyclase